MCNTDNAATLKGTINGLRANGGTQAGLGMQEAENVLKGSRADAQKVVIFFTDGTPGNYGFDETVANSAIKTAKDLKAGDALIYSIGMFAEANPNITKDQFNGYMHGVSSNYPEATAYNNLGERAADSDYYKSAADADELDEIFEEIFTEISVLEASSPFEEGLGGGDNKQAITFHDELGDYMKVDEFKSIVFADQVFKNPEVSEMPMEGGKKITYTFEGSVESGGIYPVGNLHEIEITVEHYDDAAKGDVVTVVMPASMVPLRKYLVNMTQGEEAMAIDDTHPLRIFYGASLKEEAEKLVQNPDQAMEEYIKANSKDNKVNFYSNQYHTDGKNNGGVYVQFTPKKTNDFYYFQENKKLYLDEECKEPVADKSLNPNETYYYDRVYYRLNNGKPEEVHYSVKVLGSSDVLKQFVQPGAEGLYIPQGTPRVTALDTYALKKESNATETADYVTAPNWEDVKNPKDVIVRLGNNGVRLLEVPGSLEVAKTVQVESGNPDENTEFTFEITLTGNNVKENYDAQRFDNAENPVGSPETITFAENKATVRLKDKQKIQLYGLAADMKYTVKEINIPNGFTVESESLEGTINAGIQSKAVFTNTYKAKEVVIPSGDAVLKGKKVIESSGAVKKTFEVGDSFRFDITASDSTDYPSPLPTPATTRVEVNEGSDLTGKESADIFFGKFEFTEEGEYRYSIREYLATGTGEDPIVPGIIYDTTNYRLSFKVEDNGHGELKLKEVVIERNSGSPNDNTWEAVYTGVDLPENVEEYLTFTNIYEGEHQTISLRAQKTMLNKKFTDYREEEQFAFVVEGKEEGQPMPKKATEGVYAGKYIYRNDTTGYITIPEIVFEPTDANPDGSAKEYTYYIREIQPTVDGTVDGAAYDESAVKKDGAWTYKGVTFDNTTKEVKVKVSRIATGGKDGVHVEIDYGTGDGSLPLFTNVYNASIKYKVSGEKKITGRTFNGDESFIFNIKAKDNAPLPINAVGEELKSVEVKPDKDTFMAEIDFGIFKFDQNDMIDGIRNVDGKGHAFYEKTFEYTITEADCHTGGMKYDTTPRNLFITVIDDGYGKMSFKTIVMEQNTDGKFVWNNVYTSSMDYNNGNGISIFKTLKGRAMKSDEFAFTIAPQEDTPALAASDASFFNTAGADGIAIGMKKLTSLKFTQDDAGKSFIYIIDETEPEDDNVEKAGIQQNGVTYDQSQYQVVITPSDNGDGTMSATTVVTRVKDQAGNQVTEEVDFDEIAFVNEYEAGAGSLDGATALEVTKNFIGRENNEWLAGDAFTFDIVLDETNLPKGVTAADVTMSAPTEITIDSNDEDKKASFGDITFNKPGVYTFKVSEKQDNLAAKGIMPMDSVKTIKILVTDTGNGTLQAVKNQNDSEALYFTNRYEAAEAVFGGINVEKKLSGRNWEDNDTFSFQLEANDDATESAIDNGHVILPEETSIDINKQDIQTENGYSEKFGSIIFDRAGEYSFKVTELKGAIPEIIYDTEDKVVYIKVYDDKEGSLVAKVKGTNHSGSEILKDNITITVTNTYKAASVELNGDNALKARKELIGRDWKSDDSFEFKLAAVSGAPMPAAGGDTIKVTDENAVTFGSITYTAAGEYQYTITETKGSISDLTYDGHACDVTVKVRDNTATGKLEIESVTYTDGTEAVFKNVAANNTKVVKDTEDKNIGGKLVGVGEELTYEINWTNNAVDETTGAPTGANVIIKDQIPSGTTFVEADNGGSYQNGTVTWKIKAEAAATGTVSFKVRVDESAVSVDEISNQAKIEIGENEFTTNKVSNSIPKKTETTNPGEIKEGTVLTYQIQFRNADGEGAGATVTDTLSQGLEYQPGSAKINGESNEPMVDDQRLTWNLTGLKADAEVKITFNVKVTRDALSSVDNKATVNGHQSNTVTTPYPSDDKKTATNEEGQNVDDGMIGVGDKLTYTIDWAAEEDGTVIVTDRIPSGTKYVVGSADQGGKEADGTITWTFKDVKAGEKGRVSFQVEVLDSAAGSDIANSASIQVGENEPKVTNKVETFVPEKKSKVVGGVEAQVGKLLTYTIDYKNTEDVPATVTIQDKIPEGLEYVDGSAGEFAKYNSDNRTLTWILENVAAKAKGTVTFQARITEAALAQDKIDNTAKIQVGDNNPEVSANTDSVTLAKTGTLAISKKIELTPDQGTVINTEKVFTFTVNLKDAGGKNLTGEYEYTIQGGKDGKLKDGGTIVLKHGETAIIRGLPSGANYTVTEKAEKGYTSSLTKENNSGTIPADDSAKVEVTNTYRVAEGSVTGAEHLKVTKDFAGRDWLETDAFTFKLEAGDEATQNAVDAKVITLPENAREIKIDKATADKTAAFGDIAFTKTGTYKFKVSEVVPHAATEGVLNGITYDRTTKVITVKVTDQGDGTLKTEVVEGSDNLTFVNVYHADSGDDDIAAQIQATKKLSGRDMNAEEFNFEVVTRAKDENVEGFKPQAVALGTNAEAAKDAAGKVTFAGKEGVLTYTLESLAQAVTDGYAMKDDEASTWTLYYVAKETGTLPGGVTVVEGKGSFDFEIEVKDNKDGTLSVEVQYPENGIAFENMYETGGTSVDTTPTGAAAFFYKVLEGREWMNTDRFTFTIAPLNDAPAPAETTATVTKADVTNGKAPFGFGKIKFTDADMTGAVKNADGKPEKTFTYSITENDIDKTAMPGVKKDTHTATLKITLTDDGEGTLSAAVTPLAENGIFTNSYKSELDYGKYGGFRITKVLYGRDLEMDQFTFTVTPKDTNGNTTAEEAAKKLGLENGANEYKNVGAPAGEAAATTQNIISVPVKFTQADDGKIYTYEVAEKVDVEKESYYIYDKSVRTVTIVVEDNHNATLTVTTTVTKEGEVVNEQVVTTGATARQQATVAFENTYIDIPVTLGGEGHVNIKAVKTLSNRPLENGEFIFHVWDNAGKVVTSGTNDTDGNITFNPVEYFTDKLIEDEKAHLATVDKEIEFPTYVYTYDYTVVEDTTGLAEEGVAGITTEFAVKVIVRDNADGTLEIEVVYPSSYENGIVFENTYGASANAEIHLLGLKNYVVESGDNAPDITGKYQFTISGEEGAPMPANITVSNDKAGNVDFGRITYTIENVFGDTGVAAEETVEAVNETEETVEAVDETEETVETVNETEETVETVNETEETVETVNETEETVEAVNETEETVEAVNETEETAETVNETEDTEVSGATAELMQVSDDVMVMSVPRTKTFTYTVTESGEVPGVVNDPETVKTFTVTVTDNGDGTISVNRDWGEGVAFTFTNTYKVKPIHYSISDDITVLKILSGRGLNEGEFEFEVVDKEGNVVAAASNAADGTVTFPEMNFEFTTPGEYHYTVREKNNALGGVEYDAREYEVIVTVVDNGDGTMSASANVNAEDSKTIVFENAYKAQNTLVTFGASKVYKDGELKKGQFTFELKNEKGEVIATAKNNENGQIVFDTVEFDTAGTYKYTISEVNDKQKNVTYDNTEYVVTVTVTDDLAGYLHAEVTYEDGKAPVFTNKYTKPEEPKPEKPNPEKPNPEEPNPEETKKPETVKTGDEANVAGMADIALLAIAAVAGALAYRRRRFK